MAERAIDMSEETTTILVPFEVRKADCEHVRAMLGLNDSGSGNRKALAAIREVLLHELRMHMDWRYFSLLDGRPCVRHVDDAEDDLHAPSDEDGEES